ncbi:hypothetical protein LTR87_006654 [Friedmanniomyces endolithicus]|nr:hypothetical protein LTR87_006654 [Friedmanniomyces endolithicus]
MRTALAAAANRRATRNRARSKSLSTVPPADTSSDYLPELAVAAASILYRSPLPSKEGLPVYIINAAAFPDAWEVDYDSLLSYVLARLPGEDELLSGTEYEVIFFAGGQPEGATTERRQGAGMGWYLQAYHVLSRATRKKLRRLYIVHPRAWVRVLIGVFGTVVSPKFQEEDRSRSTPRRSMCRTRAEDEHLEPAIRYQRISILNITSEGLFRIPPHSTLAGVLKESYDRGQQYIIWKEKTATVVQPGIDPSLLSEVRLEDAYGVHLAASLIKLWYRELREPIIPESSYAGLREKYGSPDAQVTPEDLAELILVASPTAPLTPTSRQILTRHLLPLLSAVAAHEPQNKMNAENLAILFSMCLVCGSNQMEDAMMANVIKKILQAAISMWQELRRGLGIDARAFEADLQPPPELRDYEDPVEDEIRQHMISEDDAVENREGHRIVMADLDGAPETKRAPTLPLRPLRARAASAAKQLLPSLEITSPVKRKPAPASASFEHAPATLDPPRYSTVFDGDGRSLHVADSPASYVPADGFGPARRGEPVRYGDEKKQGMPLCPEPTEPHPALNMPKRKALSTEQHDEPNANSEPPIITYTTARSASEGSSLARMAAQKAASSLAQHMGSPSASSKSSTDGSEANVQISQDTTPPQANGGFRKPTWPASANRQPTSFPTPTSSTKPAPTLPSTVSASAAGPSSAYVAALPTATPRPRAPSPALLKRFETIEAATTTKPTPEETVAPRRMNLKKASVDDLRRLYEERLSTAEALRSAEFVRRGSAVGIGSQGSSFSSV